ncbi:uncharacterized protein MONBRDRAFT_22822 [Monosiga brevicollis MX1]|uniref:Exoribonuclease phosphorolytic domain-containing protein n=1 Tax=Monosiga brevicollis TaxID=81824 RepID=A9US69_MONBE|nr:uncharacterized protein MONBRDRAFT_22822 [Monosiga brevicollis MX1]EDQ91728.1 predicted protein [Monosiga brevicollis MX1]|eukprot:XP_001743014.1 hypothetical protein [Monosiga brevicollis MX1]
MSSSTNPNGAAREDGRAPNQLRELSCDFAVNSAADGSARFRLGQTCVEVSVFGFRGVPVRSELPDRSAIEVSFRGVGGQRKVTDAAAENFLRECVDCALQVHEQPRSQCAVAAHVVQDDGGVLAALASATCLALLDAGLPMTNVFVGVSSAFDAKGGFLLDPSATEAQASANATVVLSCGAEGGRVLACEQHGPLTPTQLDYVLQSSQATAAAFAAFVRKSFERSKSPLGFCPIVHIYPDPSSPFALPVRRTLEPD